MPSLVGSEMCIRDRFWLEGASGEQLRGKLLELHRILKRIEYRKDAADGEIYRKLEAYLSLIHISEPTRLGMISYAVFCLKKKRIPYSA